MNKADAARKGRKKGSRGESQITKLFSKWYGKKNSFLRTRTSGAHFKNIEPGDIVCPPKFPLILEVKNAEGWNFHSLLKDAKSSTLLKYYSQVYADYESYLEQKSKLSHLKIPCVVFTKNFHPWYMLYDIKLFSKTGLIGSDYYLKFEIDGVEFKIQLLSDFFKNNTLSAFELGLKFEG